MDSSFSVAGVTVIKAKTIEQMTTILNENPFYQTLQNFRVIVTVPELSEDKKGIALEAVCFTSSLVLFLVELPEIWWFHIFQFGNFFF